MTDIRIVLRANTIHRVAQTTFLMTGLALAGCSHPEPGPVASTARVYAADVTGAAKVCDVPKIDPVSGKGFDAAIKVTNDGGWCGIPVHQEGPKPFGAGLLEKRAAHGDVLIHEVGDDTRIDYTPDRGFAGKDAFVVKLIPGDATLHVAVTVTPPAAASASVSAAAAGSKS
jgi:hypothetical protein